MINQALFEVQESDIDILQEHTIDESGAIEVQESDIDILQEHSINDLEACEAKANNTSIVTEPIKIRIPNHIKNHVISNS